MFGMLLFATIALAQDDYVLPPIDVPFQVHETPQVEIQDNARMHYDVYGRVTLVEEVLPLGYSATTEYIWWPNTYLSENGLYETRVKGEIGILFNSDQEQAGFFSISYDEDGNETGKVTEGGQLVRRLLSLFATILGIEINEENDPFS